MGFFWNRNVVAIRILLSIPTGYFVLCCFWGVLFLSCCALVFLLFLVFLGNGKELSSLVCVGVFYNAVVLFD